MPEKKLLNKIKFDGVPEDSISVLKEPNYDNLIKVAIQHSDAVIIASEHLSSSLTKFIESSGKPFLSFFPKEDYAEHYLNFYKNKVL